MILISLDSRMICAAVIILALAAALEAAPPPAFNQEQMAENVKKFSEGNKNENNKNQLNKFFSLQISHSIDESWRKCLEQCSEFFFSRFGP